MDTIDNKKIYDEKWQSWLDMKRIGPASRWLRDLIDACLQELKPGEVASILDLGCGEGTNTFFIAQKLPSAQVLGTDFSISGIFCAQKSYQAPNLRFIHDEASSSLAHQYDLVSAFEVLEHVDDWQSFLEKMVQASNRYLLLSFPIGRMRPFEKNVGHFRNYRKGEVENFLAGHGFRPVKLFYAGWPFYSPLYREICNLTDSANNRFTQGRYGRSQKIVAGVIFFFFRFLSSGYRFGDQFCGLVIKI
jgi:SAM-dependent methyltransferase